MLLQGEMLKMFKLRIKSQKMKIVFSKAIFSSHVIFFACMKQKTFTMNLRAGTKREYLVKKIRKRKIIERCGYVFDETFKIKSFSLHEQVSSQKVF